MECADCYKYRLCWYCAKVFGCRKEKPDEPSEEAPEGCFKCDREKCPKEKEARE